MYKVSMYGYTTDENENLVNHVVIRVLEGSRLINQSDVVDLPKIFKIDDIIAVYADNMAGLGWVFGSSILNPIEDINSLYDIDIKQSEDNVKSPCMEIRCDTKPIIDGIFGDAKVELKTLLNKYGLGIDIDQATLSVLLDEIKKIKVPDDNA
jgi:hypothetical protein